MEKVTIADVEPSGVASDVDRRGLSDPLETTDMAINRYRLAPGERLSSGIHTHMDQEEIFVVIAGEATFETLDGEMTVGEDEAIRFGPGEYQSGKNSGDGTLVVFALGAPRDSEDVRVPETCRDCGHENMRAIPGDEGFILRCPECGTEVSV